MADVHLSPVDTASVSRSTIRSFFAEIPATYDLINFLITGGLDRYWRKRAARIAGHGGGRRWLDICAGTGQMTLNLSRQAGPETRITALDFSLPMLSRLSPGSAACPVDRCLGEVGALPFPDDSFDLVTVAFATRNLHASRATLLTCFGEIRRILKPGGRFVNLETSQPSSPLVRMVFHALLSLIVALIGRVISGSASPYEYLASSIRAFYPPQELSALLAEAGFRRIVAMPMTCGAVAAHLAWKDRLG